jgi:hypothetical protein
MAAAATGPLARVVSARSVLSVLLASAEFPALLQEATTRMSKAIPPSGRLNFFPIKMKWIYQ